MERLRTPLPTPKTSAKTAFFSQVPSLVDLGLERLTKLASRVSQQSIARREPLWEEGAEVTHLYWVRSGVFREVRTLGEGREYVLGFYGRADLLGEVGFLSCVGGAACKRGTTALAHEEATVYALPLTEAEALLLEHPQLLIVIAAISAERRAKIEERLATAPFRTVHARFASALLELGSTFGVRDSRGLILNLKLTHRDLAALAGASRETASLALRDWRRDGLLLVEDKRVVLLDVERLSTVAQDAGGGKGVASATEER